MAEKTHIPAKYRREGLTAGDFACPRAHEDGRVVAKYPLNKKSRVVNAMARWGQEKTHKCPGGMKKICAGYRKHDLTHTEAYKEHCR